MAFAASKASYIFRHTSNINSKISEARQALGLMWKNFHTFEAEAEKMINEALAMGEFEQIVAELWPLADDASDTTRNNAKQRTATLRSPVRAADTQAAPNAARRAGNPSLEGDVDHYAPAKSDLVRATRALTGTGADIKARAFELLAV